jgi:hypothetical protein
MDWRDGWNETKWNIIWQTNKTHKMRWVLDKYDPFDGMNFHAQNKYIGWMCDAFHWMKVKLDLKIYVINVIPSNKFQ